MKEAWLLSNVVLLRKSLRKFHTLRCVVGQPRSPATEDNTRYLHVQIFQQLRRMKLCLFQEIRYNWRSSY